MCGFNSDPGKETSLNGLPEGQGDRGLSDLCRGWALFHSAGRQRRALTKCYLLPFLVLLPVSGCSFIFTLLLYTFILILGRWEIKAVDCITFIFKQSKMGPFQINENKDNSGGWNSAK